MIKSKLYNLLNKYLAEYLYGFSEDQLQVAILSGLIQFSSVNFKPQKLNQDLSQFNLPFRIKAGILTGLKVKFNLMNWKSDTIEINIDECLVVMGAVINLDQTLTNKEKTEETEQKNSQNKFFHEELNSGSECDGLDTYPYNFYSIDPKEKEGSYFERQLQRIISNLKLKINKIHIRYEDDIYNEECPYSIGLIIRQISLQSHNREIYFESLTANAAEKPHTKDIENKLFQIQEFGVYIDGMSEMIVPSSLWEATLNNQYGIFEAYPAQELHDMLINSMEMPHNFIINPIKDIVSYAAVNQEKKSMVKAVRGGKPALVCDVIIPSIKIFFFPMTFKVIESFLDYLQNVQLWPQMVELRPQAKIIIYQENAKETETQKQRRKKIIQSWFYYALQFVKKRHHIKKQVTQKFQILTQGKQPQLISTNGSLFENNQSSEQNSFLQEDLDKSPTLYQGSATYKKNSSFDLSPVNLNLSKTLISPYVSNKNQNKSQFLFTEQDKYQGYSKQHKNLFNDQKPPQHKQTKKLIQSKSKCGKNLLNGLGTNIIKKRVLPGHSQKNISQIVLQYNMQKLLKTLDNQSSNATLDNSKTPKQKTSSQSGFHTPKNSNNSAYGQHNANQFFNQQDERISMSESKKDQRPKAQLKDLKKLRQNGRQKNQNDQQKQSCNSFEIQHQQKQYVQTPWPSYLLGIQGQVRINSLIIMIFSDNCTPIQQCQSNEFNMFLAQTGYLRINLDQFVLGYKFEEKSLLLEVILKQTSIFNKGKAQIRENHFISLEILISNDQDSQTNIQNNFIRDMKQNLNLRENNKSITQEKSKEMCLKCAVDYSPKNIKVDTKFSNLKIFFAKKELQLMLELVINILSNNFPQKKEILYSQKKKKYE